MILIEKAARVISRFSPTLVDRIVRIVASSELTHHLLKIIEFSRLKKIKKLKNVLVISDINIGDAVISQTVIATLRRAFPDVKISYCYQKKAHPLIKTNPYIDIHYPYFESIGIPSQKDHQKLMNLLKKNNYDIVFNLCPYFPHKIFNPSQSHVLYPIRMIGEIIRAYSSNGESAHFAYRLDRFSLDLVKNLTQNNVNESYLQSSHSLPHIFMGETLLKESKELLNELGVTSPSRKVMFNPDTSSIYTLIPSDFQSVLLEGLAALDSVDYILMNRGFTFEGIEKKVIDGIPPGLQKKIKLLPKNIKIDIYAALTDLADVFISGDTAPLHIAAAKKYSAGVENLCKNRTSIIGIFGATSGKIYGYDSFSPEYNSPAQDAPAKVFESQPPCKNLTCIDKAFINCRELFCFQGITPEKIVEFVHDCLIKFKNSTGEKSRFGQYPFSQGIENKT